MAPHKWPRWPHRGRTGRAARQLARELTEKIEKYISDNRKIFEGYAPQQEEMLKNYVLETNTNTLFFYVGEESEAVKDAFNNAL